MYNYIMRPEGTHSETRYFEIDKDPYEGRTIVLVNEQLQLYSKLLRIAHAATGPNQAYRQRIGAINRSVEDGITSALGWEIANGSYLRFIGACELVLRGITAADQHVTKIIVVGTSVQIEVSDLAGATHVETLVSLTDFEHQWDDKKVKDQLNTTGWLKYDLDKNGPELSPLFNEAGPVGCRDAGVDSDGTYFVGITTNHAGELCAVFAYLGTGEEFRNKAPMLLGGDTVYYTLDMLRNKLATFKTQGKATAQIEKGIEVLEAHA